MKENGTVSVQITGYSGEEQLRKIIEGVLAQKIKYKLELNIIENNTIQNLDQFLEGIVPETLEYNILRGQPDFFGLTRVSGKYIAFCCYGDFWIDDNKLKRQIDILENNLQYSGCVHDINLINRDGLPYRHAVQQIYKKRRFSPDKVFEVKQLQNYLYPGAVSTLVCRNIFQKEHVQEWITGETKSPLLRLYIALVMEGGCYNLSNEMLASRLCLAPYKYPMTSYSYAVAKNELNELREICQYTLSNYDYKFDKSYRLIQIASLNFEVYKRSGKNSEKLKEFMRLYDLAYKSKYDKPAEECHSYSHEKTFFEFLRDKVYWYQICKGTKEELILLKHLNIFNDEARIERIMQCYRYSGSANSIIRKKLICEAENVEYVKKTVRHRILSAPIRKGKRKSIALGKKIHRKVKKVVTYSLRKKGFSEYMANEWYDTVLLNLITDKETPLNKKIWCYQRGFMPWRLFQYGLTEDNYKQFLSDRDYMYLHQINNTYKKWIEDKMTFRYVLEPFKEYLPKYYYQIIRREGCPVLVSLMDCPEGYTDTFDELFRLLREKRVLALKAASGTHGIGFYKMAYENGTYYMNNEESSEYEIMQIINSFQNFYIVTEYITMHDEIKRLYAGSVNTLRIMMINRNGHDPQLLDAYMRIGSSTTGTTDNVAFGGVFCHIDMESGRYGNAEQSKNHVLVACPYHPDTNEPVEGIIPHWELIKEKLIEISNYMCQLEYLGFDVVCTPDGFTILEINSHQDLHRYIYYDERIKKFYFDKLEYKHRLYK